MEYQSDKRRIAQHLSSALALVALLAITALFIVAGPAA